MKSIFVCLFALLLTNFSFAKAPVVGTYQLYKVHVDYYQAKPELKVIPEDFFVKISVHKYNLETDEYSVKFVTYDKNNVLIPGTEDVVTGNAKDLFEKYHIFFEEQAQKVFDDCVTYGGYPSEVVSKDQNLKTCLWTITGRDYVKTFSLTPGAFVGGLGFFTEKAYGDYANEKEGTQGHYSGQGTMVESGIE